ncbi:glycosyltransferase [Chloroflexota bacterium]
MIGRRPKISICIPNYNYSSFIGEAIQSVLDQDLTDFEIVVVDDASTDNSASVVASFSDERIKYFQNDNNIGRVKNINKSLLLGSGEYITLLPSDDILLPASLKKRAAVLDSNPRVGFVYSLSSSVKIDGSVVPERRLSKESYISSGEDEFTKLIFGNYIPVLTTMVRKECYETLGVFSEAVTGCADWEMWLRICLNGYYTAFVAEVLTCDRKHSGNISNYHRQTNLKGMAQYRVIKTVFSNLPLGKDCLSYLEPKAVKTIARSMLASAGVNLIREQNSLARRNIGLAIAIDDCMILNWKAFALLIVSFLPGLHSFKKMLPNFVKKVIYRGGAKNVVGKKLRKDISAS